MNIQVCALIAGGLCVSFAHGEILTGEWQGNHFGGELPGLGFQIETDGNSVGDDFATGDLIFGSDPGVNPRFLIDNETGPHYDQNSFDLGESLSANSGTSGILTFALFEFGDDITVVDALGAIGETQFIGFQLGSGSSTTLGFIEFVRLSEDNFDVIGWAYETEMGVDLVTFHIPAPSGIAAFGLAGLCLTRRRRG